MSAAIDALKLAWRDYVTDGVPATGDNEPDKPEVRAAFDRLETELSSIGAAILRYETKALLDANTTATDGQLAYVWGDGTAANNTVYQSDGGTWGEAEWYFDAVAAVVQPLVDDAEAAAITATAASVAFTDYRDDRADPSFNRARQQLVYDPEDDDVVAIVIGTNGGIALGWDVANEVLVGSGLGTTGLYDTILPNDPRLLLSDYYAITERSGERLRFIRDGITDSNNYQHCMPGARAGFWCTGSAVEFDVYWNNLVTRDDVENMVAAVLADDVLEETFASTVAPTATGAQTFSVDFGSAALRKVELVWPYGTGMDLTAVRVSRGAGVSLAPDRPTRRLIVIGDSITHGFTASSIATSWPFLVAQAMDYQLINGGYGSGLANASDADFLDGIDALTADDVIVINFGYNHFATQEATATFEATLEALFAAVRVKAPLSPVFVWSMLYTPNTNTITPAMYRTATEAAFDDWADGNSTFVDGLSLMTNSNDRLAEGASGVHPNDLGSSEIAAEWETLLPA